MTKITVSSSKRYLAKLINELYDLNTVHIINHSKAELDIGTPLENASKLSEALVKVRSLISSFSIERSSGNRELGRLGVKNFRQLTKSVKQIQEETVEKIEKIKKSESQIKNTDAKIKILEELAPLELSPDMYGGYRSLCVFVGYVKNPKALAKDLDGISGEHELKSSKNLIALFAPISLNEKLSEELSRHNFAQLDISPVQELKSMPADAVRTLSGNREKLSKEKAKLAGQLDKLGLRWKDFLLASENFLSTELEKAEAPLRFASSENIFVITGWIPSGNSDSAEKRINRITRGNVSIALSQPEHEDEVPVKLSNNRFSKPFEFLMNLYALPKYNEVDPTIFLFITFPMFFGIILGDMGYGAVIAALAFFVSKKFPSAAPLARLMMPAALSSIFFGALFGEIFGFEEIKLLGLDIHLPYVLHRITEITTMLYVSVFVGFLHVNIGLLLGFINELEHGLKKAILAKGSWWVLQAGIAAIAATSLGLASLHPLVGYGITALAVVMIYMGESISGLVEIPALFSNILSYSRLMAVGLASVGLAVVVNGFMAQFAQSGGLMIIPAILIGIAGHSLNIALGLLGGFLHSIRLHYVEFFTKFFKGGAIPFDPFGKKTQEVT